MRLKSKDFKNLASLTSIQVSNALLPLLVFPYILASVGEDGYSRMVLAESLSFIVLAISLYSFEVNGVSRIVSIGNHRKKNPLSEAFSIVFYTRIVLFTLVLIIVIALYLISSNLFFLLLCGWMLVPLSHIFQSAYFYQAVENNLPLAIIVVLSRGASAIAVCWGVNNPGDEVFAPFIIGGFYLLGALFSFWYITKVYEIKLSWGGMQPIYQSLSDGKEIFFGNMSVFFFRDSYVLVLGIVGASPVAISTFSIAEKYVKAFQAIARPLNRLFFPKVIRRLANFEGPSRSSFAAIFRMTLPQLLLVCIAFCILVGLYSEVGSVYLKIEAYQNLDRIELLVLLMIPAVLFGVANYMFGVAGLNFLGAKVYLAKSLFLVAGVSLLNCFLLAKLYLDIGAAISFALAEVLLFIFISACYFLTSNKKGVNKERTLA